MQYCTLEPDPFIAVTHGVNGPPHLHVYVVVPVVVGVCPGVHLVPDIVYVHTNDVGELLATAVHDDVPMD